MCNSHVRGIVSFLCLFVLSVASATAQDRAQAQLKDQDTKLRKLGIPDKAMQAAHLMWGPNLDVGQDAGERAHRLWGATRVTGPTDFAGYLYARSVEGKQEVMAIWAGEPDRSVQSFDEIKTLVGKMPVETTIDLTQEQSTTLRQTVSEILAINTLPAPEGPDRLIAFHTARNAKPDIDGAVSAYKSVLRDTAEVPAPSKMRDLLIAIWQKLFDGQARWDAVCPEGCLISVWRIGDGSAVGFHSEPTTLGTQSGPYPPYYSVVRTLRETIDAAPNQTAVVAEVTILARWAQNANQGPRNADTFPIVISFHWEPMVNNWIADNYTIPLFPFFPPGGPPHAFSMKDLTKKTGTSASIQPK